MAVVGLEYLFKPITWDRALASLLVLTVSILTARTLYNLFLHPLSSIPGPRLWSTTALFYTNSMRNGQYAQKLKTLHLRYGPVLRIAPDEVSVIDHRAWTEVYSGPRNFAKSERWFSARPNGAFGILTSPKSSHARFRRAFAPAFTERALAAREPLIKQHVDVLVRKFDGLAGSGSAVNITDELEYVAFDLAGDFGFSEQFRCLEEPDNRPQIRQLQNHMKIFSMNAMRRSAWGRGTASARPGD